MVACCRCRSLRLRRYFAWINPNEFGLDVEFGAFMYLAEELHEAKKSGYAGVYLPVKKIATAAGELKSSASSGADSKGWPKASGLQWRKIDTKELRPGPIDKQLKEQGREELPKKQELPKKREEFQPPGSAEIAAKLLDKAAKQRPQAPGRSDIRNIRDIRTFVFTEAEWESFGVDEHVFGVDGKLKDDPRREAGLQFYHYVRSGDEYFEPVEPTCDTHWGDVPAIKWRAMMRWFRLAEKRVANEAKKRAKPMRDKNQATRNQSPTSSRSPSGSQDDLSDEDEEGAEESPEQDASSADVSVVTWPTTRIEDLKRFWAARLKECLSEPHAEERGRRVKELIEYVEQPRRQLYAEQKGTDKCAPAQRTCTARPRSASTSRPHRVSTVQCKRHHVYAHLSSLQSVRFTGITYSLTPIYGVWSTTWAAQRMSERIFPFSRRRAGTTSS